MSIPTPLARFLVIVGSGDDLDMQMQNLSELDCGNTVLALWCALSPPMQHVVITTMKKLRKGDIPLVGLSAKVHDAVYGNRTISIPTTNPTVLQPHFQVIPGGKTDATLN